MWAWREIGIAAMYIVDPRTDGLIGDQSIMVGRPLARGEGAVDARPGGEGAIGFVGLGEIAVRD